MKLGQAWGAKIGDDLKERMIDAMRKEGLQHLNPLICNLRLSQIVAGKRRAKTSWHSRDTSLDAHGADDGPH